MRASDSASSPFVALTTTASRATHGAASRATSAKTVRRQREHDERRAVDGALAASDVQRTAAGSANSGR